MRLNALPGLVCVLLLTGTPDAGANIFDVYGMGARGIAMGGAHAAATDDYSATFYNPAALARHRRITFGAGFMFTQPALNVTQAPGDSETEAVLPGSFSGFHIGWVVPFSGVFDNKLAVGVAFYVPTINLVRAEALDPQTPQFYMYQNLPDQLMLLTSIAYEPVHWFRFGIGVQILADVFGEAAFRLDIVNNEFERSELTVELLPSAAMTAGLHFEPIQDRLRIGVTYRQEHGLQFGLPAEIVAEDVLRLGLEVAGSVLYTPHQINTGVSYTWHSIGLTASVELDVALWSLAPDPSPSVGIDLGGGLLDAFGLGEALDIGKDLPPIDLKFRNTVTPRVGLDYRPLDWFSTQLGYFYRPTPAPRAQGPFNYLDNDVHGFSGGTIVTFSDPFTDDDRPIEVQLAAALGWLPQRTVLKENRGDPVGDLEHGGLTLSVNVTVNHSF